MSGLAFLVACTSSKGLTRAEKKQLKEERSSIISLIEQQRHDSQVAEQPGIVMQYRDSEYQLRKRLSVINSQLGDRDAQMDNGEQMSILLTEMDSLQAVIDANNIKPLLYGPPTIDPNKLEQMKAERRKELQSQLDQLMQAIQHREGACVYGSPEIIQKYGEETLRMKKEADQLREQIKELDNDGNTGEE